MIKIAFYGESGCGKSTIATVTKEYYEKKNKTIEVIKFAYPLYYIQNVIYKIAGIEMDYYAQHQKMLEDICSYMREINPTSLIDNFNERLEQSIADVVINDDVRETKVDYPFLKRKGFKFVRVTCDEKVRCQRLTVRNDLKSVVKSQTTLFIDEIIPDYVIDTTEVDFNNVCEKLFVCLDELKEDKK